MDTNKKEFLEAFVKHKGVIQYAADEAGISRQTFYNWKKKDKEFAAAVEDVEEASKDRVESKLFELIEGVQVQKIVQGEEVIYSKPPDVTAIIFYLKTKAKDRGYTEKQEIKLNDINVSIKVVE